MKLWAGRFEKETDALTDSLNASFDFDKRMFREDITGSIAHARMLGASNIISPGESEEIISGLKSILKEMEDGTLSPGEGSEDIHMFVETVLTERIGEAGKRLHTARSRNDQVALDIKLYLRREITDICEFLLKLLTTLSDIAKENLDTVMPAYTHLQRAQPTTFAHYMMAYASMFKRDVTRLEDCLERMDEMPLGSGALTSTTYPINRDMVAAELSFSRLTENSLDGVSDRDFIIELLSCLSILIMHLSRFSEEIILWCSWEFKFIELDDAFATGSSIMPQKKNPDIAELTRGKTGRIYGSLMSALTVMKGLPLAYNKDMQEDKEPVFDAVDTIKAVLPVFTAMLKTMVPLKDNMRLAASRGFINATDCADYLTKKGMPFRDAYAITGRIVNLCIKESKTLETLELDKYREHSELFDDSIYAAIRLETCVEARFVKGGPSKSSVEAQILSADLFVSERFVADCNGGSK